jgi:hypothetical protein
MARRKTVDRRWSSRVDVFWDAIVKTNRQPAHRAHVVNAGFEGLLLELDGFPAVNGEVVDIELRIPAADPHRRTGIRRLRASACVIHRGANRLGVMFTRFNNKLFRALEQALYPNLDAARNDRGISTVAASTAK